MRRPSRMSAPCLARPRSPPTRRHERARGRGLSHEPEDPREGKRTHRLSPSVPLALSSPTSGEMPAAPSKRKGGQRVGAQSARPCLRQAWPGTPRARKRQPIPDALGSAALSGLESQTPSHRRSPHWTFGSARAHLGRRRFAMMGPVAISHCRWLTPSVFGVTRSLPTVPRPRPFLSLHGGDEAL